MMGQIQIKTRHDSNTGRNFHPVWVDNTFIASFWHLRQAVQLAEIIATASGRTIQVAKIIPFKREELA